MDSVGCGIGWHAEAQLPRADVGHTGYRQRQPVEVYEGRAGSCIEADAGQVAPELRVLPLGLDLVESERVSRLDVDLVRQARLDLVGNYRADPEPVSLPRFKLRELEAGV